MLRQPRKNHILASLPDSVLQAWTPHFEFTDLPAGKVLYEPGKPLSHICFPITAIISWLYYLENGASTQVAVTGREGLLGLYLLLGSDQPGNTAMVQTAGEAVRIRADVVMGSARQDPAVQRLIFAYAQALITQMAQISVCHRHHNLEQQLCRMLLLTLDRQDGDTLHMTQEQMASLLGVRREGVTLAASRLMKDGLIDYARGRITVRDFAALKARTCECYGVVQQAYNRLLPMPT